MANPPVRTITLGLENVHPISAASIRGAGAFLQRARVLFVENGHEVQTVRLSTRPVLEDLADWSNEAILHYVGELQKLLQEVGLEHCSLGPVPAWHRDFPLERLDLLPDLLQVGETCNVSVQLAYNAEEPRLRAEAALPAARVIKRLAAETIEGFGNFRFAMLACMPPGTPFFPAAYHRGSSTFSIGLQGASLLIDVLTALRAESTTPLPLEQITEKVRHEIEAHQAIYRKLTYQIERETGVRYTGIDYSPAPLGADSIVTAIELCGYGRFGSAGTLAVVAALTKAIKSVFPRTEGYNGLMLPVLEDAVLGQRWAEGLVGLQQLLLYSAVCGTGLDTIPLAGDVTEEEVAHILLDVATLALRSAKPLSARLFPVPGKRVGEYTAFTSPYLMNTLIKNPV